MWAYARITLKEAALSPISWGICLLGTFFGWFATTVAILAVADIEAQSRILIESTSQLFGALSTIGLLGRTLAEDGSSGFTLAGDATQPGPQGRLLGRWLGAVIVGVASTLLIATLTSLASPNASLQFHYLLYTTIMVIGIVGAWGVLLSSQWSGAVGALVVLVLWVVGHLPWGTPPFLEGRLGRAIGAWLPGPRPAEGGWLALGYTSAAVAGLLLLALALARPAEPRS